MRAASGSAEREKSVGSVTTHRRGPGKRNRGIAAERHHGGPGGLGGELGRTRATPVSEFRRVWWHAVEAGSLYGSRYDSVRYGRRHSRLGTAMFQSSGDHSSLRLLASVGLFPWASSACSTSGVIIPRARPRAKAPGASRHSQAGGVTKSAIRFATFGVPQPEAASQPVEALKPTGVPTSWLLPTVMSWKS